MSDTTDKVRDESALTPSQLEQERKFLSGLDSVLEKSASVSDIPSPDDFVTVEASRFDPKTEPVESAPDDVAKAGREPDAEDNGEWRDKPFTRDHMIRYPHTTRLTDPETRIFDLSDPEQLDAYNKLQKASHDTGAPTLMITEMETQKHNGSWTALVTWKKVQYQIPQ